MKRSARIISAALLGGVTAACSSGADHGATSQASSPPAAPTHGAPAASAALPDQDMIVILRDQRTDLAAVRGGPRVSALAIAQRPLIASLLATRARPIKSFGLVNGFATKLSKDEITQLTAHPLVQAVVPDAILQLPKLHTDMEGTASSASPGRVAPVALCNTLEPEALQLTNTAFSDPSVPQAQEVVDGNGVKVTGVGVKVAYLADGIDTTNQGFIRPDGTSAFADYQDFSGDPAGTPTEGAEAFGDASSIAAQDMPNGTPLTFDISQFVSAAHPLPSPCNIRVRGMAPGASLVGLKVFSGLGYTSTSGFVQAIEYAVLTAGVDVINESFGGNPFPDVTTDPIGLANLAATNAGVTVTVSTGDAGSSGTLGSPSTDTTFLAVGASTAFRLYAQTGYGFQALANGTLSDNISALSSGGFAQRSPRTVDVVAPGDLGWALCSTNSALYTGCSSYSGQATPIEAFGGTSQSAPLTAGAAALIIQAFRSTHGGASPTPALVKQILMSTADDLGAPSDEEGAGRIDALAAVQMALSVGERHGVGGGLLASPSAARVTANTRDTEQVTITVTNTGATTEHLAPALETLGAPIAGKTLALQLAPATDPTFLNVTGGARPYIEQTFTVPSGADHLDAAIAIPPLLASGAQSVASLVLLDPSGRQAAYSIPQGIGSGYAHVDIVRPAAGTWTAVIDTTPTTISDSYAGTVSFTWAAERYVALGSVSPAHLTLAPGASANVTATFTAPSQPGDLAAAIRFHGTVAGVATSEVPVTVRTLIPTDGRNSGAFTATLTGGNGRANVTPTQTFELVVPSGVNDMSLALTVPEDGYSLAGYLVDPNGMALDSASTIDANGDAVDTIQLFRASPQPGLWHFVISQSSTAGTQTSIAANGKISFNTASAKAAKLPTSTHTRLSASGAPVSIPLVVTNTGKVAKAYFADARLNTYAQVSLATGVCSGDGVTSVTPGLCAYTYVPTQATDVQFVAQSTVPIGMDASWAVSGGPDLWAYADGTNTVAANTFVPEVAFGPWVMSPALLGTTPAAGAAATAVTTTVNAIIHPFDGAIAADSGDIWADLTLGTNTFAPLVLAPGASGTITVTITPDATQVGKTVSGTLYVDTYNEADAKGSGDEVTGLPYAYTVSK